MNDPAPAGLHTERGDLPGDLALFPDEERSAFRTRWDRIQTGFVDEPRRAVQDAHDLVGDLVDSLTRAFAQQRDRLEGTWSSGAEVSTEDLRRALQRYRSLFNQLLR